MTKFCYNCGREMETDGDSNWCLHCGYEEDEPETERCGRCEKKIPRKELIEGICGDCYDKEMRERGIKT